MTNDRKREQLLAKLKEREASYRPDVKLLYKPMTKTYHTALKKDTHPYAHCTYSSAVYALELLEGGTQGDAERAADILEVLLSLQDVRPQSPTFGIWPYYYEESLDEMEAPDWNYADFIGKKLVLTLKRHGDRLSEALRRNMREAIAGACRAIAVRDVGPGYTNIAAMGAFVTLVGGEVIGQRAFVDYGRNRLRKLHDYTMRLGNFVEFNSPVYTPIAIEELENIRDETKDPSAILLAENLLHIAWTTVAEHYHPRTKEWAGPHSRSYSPLLVPGSLEYGMLEDVLGSDPRTNRCPEELLPYFRSTEERQYRFPILDESETGYQSHATTYMRDNYCLGSFTKDMMWNQRRNLIAYADNQGKAAYVLLRFLKDGKDFSSAVFTGVQDKSDIVFGINMALDFGDWHPVLEPVNGAFEAKDLRIRFEFGGYIEGGNERSGDRLGFDAAVIIGEHAIRVKQLSALSDMGAARLKVARSEQDGTLGIDYVIYEGPARRFDFHRWKEAAWAFAFTMSERAENLRFGSEREAGSLIAWCEKDGRRMGISIPAKPAGIGELFRNNEISFLKEEES